jgi:hypothetical protein
LSRVKAFKPAKLKALGLFLVEKLKYFLPQIGPVKDNFSWVKGQ